MLLRSTRIYLFDISNNMHFDTPTATVLYSIEKTIKAYRKLSAKNIARVIPDITVDQALILIILNANRNLTQTELGNLVFKDYASITRILSLMEQKGYLQKGIKTHDKRCSAIEITEKGQNSIAALTPVIQINRAAALKGLTDNELIQLYTILEKITMNCNS